MSVQHPILIPALYTFAGLSIYATIVHLIVLCQGRSSKLLHGLFGGVTAMLTLFIIFHSLALTAADISTFAFGLRGSLATGYLGITILLWFITVFAQKQFSPILVVLSALMLFFSGLNWLSPFSVQFGEIQTLTTLVLPWGETVTRGVGSPSPYLLLGVISIVGSCSHFTTSSWCR